MDLYEILHRRQGLDLIQRTGFNPSAGSVNLDDMDNDSLKGLVRFLIQDKDDLKRDKEMLQKTVEDLSARLNQALESLSKIEKMLHSAQEKSAKDSALIAELSDRLGEQTKTIDSLQKQLASAYKYKEKYEDLRREKFGSKSQKRKKPVAEGRDDDKDDWTGEKPNYETENVEQCEPTELQVSAESCQPNTTHSPRPNRQGMKYAKGGVTGCSIVHHNDDSKLPEGAIVIKRRRQSVKDTIHMTVEHLIEYVTYKDKDGKMHTVHIPVENEYTGEKACQLLDALNLTQQLQAAPARVPHTRASVEMLVEVVFNSFVMESPVYREMQRFMEDNFKTCRQTILNWRKAAVPYMKEVLKVLKEQALQKNAIVNCDETWCRVRCNNKYHKGYIWCLVNKTEKIVIFFYDEGSRGRKVLTEFIEDREIYALQSDAYNVYSFLDNEMTEIVHVGCMAHVRAKFEKAFSVGKDLRARLFLELIEKLYIKERLYKDCKLTPDEIYKMRNSEDTLETVSQLYQHLNSMLAKPGECGELMLNALNYFRNNWKQVMTYRDNGRFDIDNSIAERSIRPMTVERKNLMSFGSHEGAETSALYHTFIATCRQMKKSVCNYFRNLFTAMVEGRTDYYNLTPALIG